MAVSTYSELQAALATWLQDSTIDAERTQECIRLAEGDIDLRLAGMNIRPTESRQTATLTGEYLAVPELPADFVTVKSFQLSWTVNGVTCTRRLKGSSPSGIATLAERGTEILDQLDYPTASGELPPEYYSHQGNEFRLYPPPADGEAYVETYSVQIVAEVRLPRLSDENTTNWLLTAFPNIYVNAAMMWAEIYGWNDSRAADWKGMFEEGMARLSNAYPKAKDETPLRHNLPLGRRVLS